MFKFKAKCKTIFIIISTYFLTSCAMQQLSVVETQPIKKIAIVSELDNHMHKVTAETKILRKKWVRSSMNTGDINHSIENDLAQKLWSKGTEVVILQTTTKEIMPDKTKLLINQDSYKGAQLVIIVKPIYQKEEYALFPAGYGVIEKNTLGVKQRLLYASIIYEVYSTKDGNRKGYYVVHPEGSDVIELNKNISEMTMQEYKSELYALFDELNTKALNKLGF